ncbi:hypothetical protein F7725_002435 [Dissostichus mawsoni]|uniref:C3H1-type domain-containing protein n=1 Tax=Dissostichus mawsoni TaxID=36200 RepID=A0A7J5Y2D0_DISMA|nr:hypothetical protein F7725_002435 [Dissostichus mawsoni]
MGVKDHLEDGTGHMHSLELDLDYLHVEGAERQVGLSTVTTVRLDLSPNRTPADPPQPETSSPMTPPQNTAPKWSYSEALVLLVLRKLGPDALINDILGELVKLGTKTEMEQQGGSTACQSLSSSPSSSLNGSFASSNNSSLDSCRMLCPSQLLDDKDNLRPVVLMEATKEQSRPDALITDQDVLRRLEKEKILVFTPSRRVQGRRVVCYDDRFIVKLAYESAGIIVSNDNYRDLANEKPEWKKFIDERLLMYSFVNDKFMPPDDPLGRHGPSLENFLRKRPIIPEHRKQPCPYGKKCTYGHKCKFYHPERGSQPQRAVADELRASAKMSSVASRGLLEDAVTVKSQSYGLALGMAEAEPRRASGASGPSQAETYHRCESPEPSYSSMVKNYSSLGLVVPQSPERFFPADLRGGSLLSDFGSEGSLSSDSFSPDPVLDDGHKCHHHHHHPHHHHHCSGQFSHAVSRVPPGFGQHPHGYPVPQSLRRKHDYGLEDLPASVTSHGSPRPFQSPSAYIPPHFQHPFGSSFQGEFPARSPQTSTAHSHVQNSPLGRNLMGSVWQDGGLQDSQMYKGSPLQSRRNHSVINPPLQHQMNWDPHYQQSPKPCYDPYASQSLPEVHEKAWHSPWGRQTHSSPHGLSASSLPPLHQLSLPPITTHKSHLPSVPQHQEPPALGRYQDLRERVFVNLCRIFPPDLVRMVMTRNSHMVDAQELAAAILMEKSQHGS